jgi:hypothetical protein
MTFHGKNSGRDIKDLLLTIAGLPVYGVLDTAVCPDRTCPCIRTESSGPGSGILLPSFTGSMEEPVTEVLLFLSAAFFFPDTRHSSNISGDWRIA